jgi:hypothetical protein
MMVTMQTLALFLTLLAVARVTRLVNADRITQAPRDAIVRRLDPNGMAAYMVFCPWCVSVYVGAAGGAAWWAWGDTRIFTAAVLALAASHVAGLLAGLERD